MSVNFNATYGESGVIRKMDDLGRLVLPKAVREHIHAGDGTPCELIPGREENGRSVVVIRPYDAFNGAIGCGKAKQVLNALKLVRKDQSISICIRSRSGVTMGDDFLDGKLDCEKEAIQAAIDRVEKQLFNNREMSSVWENISDREDETYGIYGFGIFGGEKGENIAIIMAYGQVNAVNAMSGHFYVAAAGLSELDTRVETE